MTIQQIYYVITIADIGSLNKASEVLYVAQPSLTSAVQELERELGITIFYRSGRGVTLTNEGEDFLSYARPLYQQYAQLTERYGKGGTRKKKFGVSAQHYSFAVKCFAELMKQYSTAEYEFAIRETKTLEVIDDVHTGKSELGVLFLSDFNRKALEKLFRTQKLSFQKLVDCDAFVYMWKGHPLAKCASIRFEQLADYPCMSFEQGGTGSFYFAEEILSTFDYPRTIRVNDRATMLNLMVGAGGYTLCSGIICEELNGSDYVAVPFETQETDVGARMEIGYITRRNLPLSELAQQYVRELQRYLTAQKK
ncbi:MAG: LysR family transcriptional regulator [Clostridia bacterium]|nr:LysR family transcriptional regulator [Clostridia bacterium]